MGQTRILGSVDLLGGMKVAGHGSALDPIHEQQTMEKDL
jgi:hypothetical protein